MHEVVAALREPESAPGDPCSRFSRSCFAIGARIKGMGPLMDKTPGDPTDPIEQLRGGDRQALATLFEKYRDRLRRMVELRLEQRLRARIDASDVVLEAFLDVARDLDAYLADPKLPRCSGCASTSPGS